MSAALSAAAWGPSIPPGCAESAIATDYSTESDRSRDGQWACQGARHCLLRQLDFRKNMRFLTSERKETVFSQVPRVHWG